MCVRKKSSTSARHIQETLDEETERDAAIEMDLALLKRCDELWAFGDEISSGMKREMKEAEKLGIAVLRITPTGQEEWICTK